MNGHDLAPVSEALLVCAKTALGAGPLHECGFMHHVCGPFFSDEDHSLAFHEEVIVALAAKGCVTIEGEKGERIVRLTS